MGERKNKTFNKSFKEETVRLMEQSGRPMAEVTREIGIPRNRLYKWRSGFERKGPMPFPAVVDKAENPSSCVG